MFKVTAAKSLAGLAAAASLALVVSTATPASAAPITQIRNAFSNKCLEVLNFAPYNGAPSGLWDCVGGTNQKWDLIPNWGGTFTIKNSNNKCLELLSFNNSNGAPVGTWDCVGGVNQQWSIVPGNVFGTVQIRNSFNNKCLELLSFNKTNGAPAGLWDCVGGINQQWYTTL